MVEVSLRTFSLVDSGGKLGSTWRIGPEAVSEAVRAFSQLRGLSGLLWSVITPSAMTPNTVSISNETRAQSGGVGEYIAQTRKRKHSN